MLKGKLTGEVLFMKHTICLIPGDGIGPEVTRAACEVLDAAGVAIQWIELPAGAFAYETHGSVLPPQTIDAIDEYKVALKGPVTTPVGKGFSSVNVQLRKRFNLYAAVRPVRSLPGIHTRYENVDLVIVRENTEGLYAELELEIVPGVVQSLRVITRTACDRISRFAFNYARLRERAKVTVFHKANIMKKSDGLFLACARAAHEAAAPGVDYEELIIDNGCMQLVRDPTRFDVLLLENYNGDFVSDLCAGFVGGLGVVPGANIGDQHAIFEAVHGSAPDLAGKGVANPLAMILSSVMLLDHIGEDEAADAIHNACEAQLAEANPDELTADIGGRATTHEFVKALTRRLK
jgi:isocitrate dehydrogenase (NAD+)